jgi:CRISPR-associated protein Cas2
MLVLVAYDVNTTTSAGQKRLARIAKECVKHGQRVQNSVFECSLDAGQYCLLKDRLLEIADLEKDNLRFYNLGNNYSNRIESYGIKTGYDPKGVLLV